jgi:hypothetical protein
VELPVVAPVDPSGCGVLDLAHALIEPGVEDVYVDAFGLVEVDDRLHQHVVVGVADRPDRGGELSQGKGLAEAD